MIRRKLSDEAVEALTVAFKNRSSIQWTALDAFRVWYTKPLEESGTEIICKEFSIKELA